MNTPRFHGMATRFAATAAPKLRTLRDRFLDVVDVLAEARMQKAKEEISRVPAARRMDSKPRIESAADSTLNLRRVA